MAAGDSKSALNPNHLECATELAAASGEVIRHYFDSDFEVETKADESPVTVADRESERVMREIVQKTFPDHGFIGEESGAVRPDAEFTWVVDPIDGTKSFVSRSFDFGTIIALLHRGSPILGIINQPVLGQLYLGDNKRCTLNGVEVKARPCPALKEAVLVATDMLNIGKFQPDSGFKKLLGEIKFARTWGNCFGYTLLARGTADIALDPIMSPWDLLGLIPVVRGAGAVISDYQGKDPVKAKSIVAAAKEIHPEVIALLNS
jgi:myo-inositol-1(or 4)-monophosphatase